MPIAYRFAARNCPWLACACGDCQLAARPHRGEDGSQGPTCRARRTPLPTPRHAPAAHAGSERRSQCGRSGWRAITTIPTCRPRQRDGQSDRVRPISVRHGDLFVRRVPDSAGGALQVCLGADCPALEQREQTISPADRRGPAGFGEGGAAAQASMKLGWRRRPRRPAHRVACPQGCGSGQGQDRGRGPRGGSARSATGPWPISRSPRIRPSTRSPRRACKRPFRSASNIIRREVQPQEHEALIGEAINEFSKLN